MRCGEVMSKFRMISHYVVVLEVYPSYVYIHYMYSTLVNLIDVDVDVRSITPYSYTLQ